MLGVFVFVDEKDMFEASFSQHLSRRLLSIFFAGNNSNRLEYERRMIEKIKRQVFKQTREIFFYYFYYCGRLLKSPPFSIFILDLCSASDSARQYPKHRAHGENGHGD